jgi:magnesium chelatase family protein
MLAAGQLDGHLGMSPEGEAMLHRAAARLAWSARSFHRVLRIARTVADLADSDVITALHVSEAIQWRRALPGRND